MAALEKGIAANGTAGVSNHGAEQGPVPAAGRSPGSKARNSTLAKNYFKPKMISQDGVAGRPRY
jgi:hypothetical protein